MRQIIKELVINMSMRANVLYNIYPEMTPKIDEGGGGIFVEIERL